MKVWWIINRHEGAEARVQGPKDILSQVVQENLDFYHESFEAAHKELLDDVDQAILSLLRFQTEVRKQKSSWGANFLRRLVKVEAPSEEPLRPVKRDSGFVHPHLRGGPSPTLSTPISVPCPACGGTGTDMASPGTVPGDCLMCGGSGRR